MPDDRRQSTSPEEHTYASRLDLVTRRLDALIHHDDGYSTAVHALLDDAMHLCDDAATWKRDDVDDALRLLDQAVMILTAAEERAQGEREVRETSGLRAYTALFAIVSQWSERFDPPVHARAGRAYVDQAKGLIGLHEVAVDRESHPAEERTERRKTLDHGSPELVLVRSRRRELERRARATGKLLGGGVVVNADFHRSAKPSRGRKSGQVRVPW